MDVDFPRFIEELIEEGAATTGVDALTYLCALVCAEANRREEARKNPPRVLPEVAPEVRERALKTVLELKERRLKADPQVTSQEPENA